MAARRVMAAMGSMEAARKQGDDKAADKALDNATQAANEDRAAGRAIPAAAEEKLSDAQTWSLR